MRGGEGRSKNEAVNAVKLREERESGKGWAAASKAPVGRLHKLDRQLWGWGGPEEPRKHGICAETGRRAATWAQWFRH